MSDSQNGGSAGSASGGTPGAAPGGGEPSQQQSLLTVHTQYVRDLSFENPNAPQIYAQMKTQPKVDLRLELPIRRIQERLFELGLKFTLNATLEEQTAFMIELDYAGLISVGNHVQEEEIEAVLAIDGARMLFPFARRVISDVARDGGFPPVMVGNMDFAQLYRQRKAQGGSGEVAQGQGGGNGGVSL
jgi:preprotein translocase subunit SecB